MNELANVHKPLTLATIAIIVGAIVRILKGKTMSDWLDRLPPAWLKRIPRPYLPWISLGLGFAIAYIDLMVNGKMYWSDALTPALAGVLSGAVAIGGHETISTIVAAGKASPGGPDAGDGGIPVPVVVSMPPPAAEPSVPPVTTPNAALAAACFIFAMFAGGAGVSGCAALATALPVVIASVIDGMQVVDAIAAFVDRYFVAHPDAAAQAKVADAIVKCRAALNVALRSAQGAKDLDDASVDRAFDDFKAAYLDLIHLTRPYGVTQTNTKALRAAPTPTGGLEVPEPLAFKRGGK